MKVKVIVDEALVPVLKTVAERELRTPERQASYLLRQALLREASASGGPVPLVDETKPPEEPAVVASGRTLTEEDTRRLGPVGVERWMKGVCLCPTCPANGRELGLCQRHYMMMYYSCTDRPRARAWFVRHGRIIDRSILVEDGVEETLEDMPRLPRGAISPEKDWLFDARETLRKKTALEKAKGGSA